MEREMKLSLTLTDMNDLATLDDAIEGALEVLADDDNSDSPTAEDYNAIIDAIRAEAMRRYPVAFPAVFAIEVSSEQAVLLRETVEDQAGWDNEFHASVVETL
jgi:hypothetical protein